MPEPWAHSPPHPSLCVWLASLSAIGVVTCQNDPPFESCIMLHTSVTRSPLHGHLLPSLGHGAPAAVNVGASACPRPCLPLSWTLSRECWSPGGFCVGFCEVTTLLPRGHPVSHPAPSAQGSDLSTCRQHVLLGLGTFPSHLVGRPSPLPVVSHCVVASPQGVSLQDLLSKLGRPFREYELWALSHACLSTLRTHRQHPGDAFFCSSSFSLCGRQCPRCEPGPPWEASALDSAPRGCRGSRGPEA